MSPGYWSKLVERLPAGMRRKFRPMIEKTMEYVEIESRREEIDAALAVLKNHWANYIKLTKHSTELLNQAEKLFSEDKFVDMRFSAADVQRAFEVVGYIPPDPTDKTTTVIMDKAIRFLLDDKQRSSIALRLLCILPDYVRAGRYLDGCIIQHSADLIIEPPEGVAGPFLMAMFLHGLREWEDLRDREQAELLRELGLNSDEIRQAGEDGLPTLLSDICDRPEKVAVMKKFLAKHPELNAFSEAELRSAEKAARRLLGRDDASCLLLTTEEVQPWLEVLDRRIKAVPGGLPSLPKGQQMDKTISKTYEDLVFGFSAEMAENIFFPARVDQLKSLLNELQRKFDEDDQDAIAGVRGALMDLRIFTTPGDSPFLSLLCWLSVRAEVNDMVSAG